MKTREELLVMAEEALMSWYPLDGEFGTSKAMFAQACIMLARERREENNSPTYVQVQDMIMNLDSIQRAIYNI